MAVGIEAFHLHSKHGFRAFDYDKERMILSLRLGLQAVRVRGVD